MNNAENAPTVSITSGEHGKLYWFWYKTFGALGRFLKRHWILTTFLGIVILFCLFAFRSVYQPFIVEVRIHLFFMMIVVLSVMFLLWLMWVLFRRSKFLGKGTAVVLAFLVVVSAALFTLPAQEYLSLYVRYQSIDKVELRQLPTTAHERIQPLSAVYLLSQENMGESISAAHPDFVRVDGSYRWTAAIEPAHQLQRYLWHVEELYSIPGTSSAVSISGENRIPVTFMVGENLFLARNTYTAVTRAFSPWKFFNYEPTDVRYLKNDEGTWVQVVSLVRWKGILFPQPEFGGVYVISQETTDVLNALRLMLFGAGEWISPEDIKKHTYLRGQNISPYSVSRRKCEGFRFQNGFTAPWPGYHYGDIRIPDLEEDLNDQPFTLFFNLDPETGKEGDGSLYHYCALEPYLKEKQGLNTSVLIPADGTNKVYMVNHHALKQVLAGVSTVAGKVRESSKSYDWSFSRPVEHRPYVRDIAGKRRVLAMTTIVTRKEEADEEADSDGGGNFIASSTPEVVITDLAFNATVKVNPLDPGSWDQVIETELGKIWSQN